MLTLFDTHAHLDFPDFNSDREEVISRAHAAGVKYILTIGSGGGLESMEQALAIAASYENIWATVGVHPHDAKLMSPERLEHLARVARSPQVAAVGEIGLDWAKLYSPREEQIKWFREQLTLARELELPVIIHDREAHGDLLRLLKQDGISPAGGVMHCWSGSLEMARELIRLGFYISFSGTVTYPNAQKLAAVAVGLPIDRMLVETDCPFLIPHPQPRRGRNEPAFVRLTAETIARLRGSTLEEIASATTQNAFRAFRLTPSSNA